jgi:phosphatidylserine/phosphatidylglycerophosphate/cardiolipin synthase-like enzyme
MFRRLQLWTGTATFLLSVLSLWVSAAPTIVQPIVDRPGSCRYCEVVESVLANAAESIDLLLSDGQMEGNPLWSAVTAAHERGVRVRVLLDRSDWAPSITDKNRPTIEYLAERGIDARFDDPAVTTHAKLAVVDRSTVVLGSTNWNRYAFTDQEQANVRIVDARVGAAFASWFDGLWGGSVAAAKTAGDPIGVRPETPTVVPLPDVDGSGHYGPAVLSLLDGARESVHVAMYRMSVYTAYSDSTSNALLEALVRAANRGLDVRVLLDDCKFYADSAAANLTSALYLHENGIPVRFDGPEETTHTKLLILDGRDVVLGSTNWNYYALERNVEANVALLGMQEVASVFDDYFEDLWRGAREVGP